MEAADFSGYATKAGIKCSDGRTITPTAFAHMDGVRVPLVWQHGHNDSKNILGHAVLKAMSDGIRAYGFFNNTEQGRNAKELVKHGDIDSLSIYANKIKEQSSQVLHGFIREVSLVLSGANPKARIDFVNIAHGDGDYTELDDEAVISLNIPLEHSDNDDEDPDGDDDDVEHANPETVQDIYNTLSEKQQKMVGWLLATALEEASAAQHSDTTEEKVEDNTESVDDDKSSEDDVKHQEGTTSMTRNVFDRTNDTDKKPAAERHAISHADKLAIIEDAKRPGQTLKGAVEAYALAHGINDIDLLFPDPRAVTDRPEWDTRRMGWVQGVIDGTHHTPFTRIKSIVTDGMTLDAARAKGYVKGNLKKEQFFGLVKRTTGPTTIYKKQKLDRDDIIDIVDFDVVAWLKVEMNFMIKEELARAILLGDGREVDDEDHIKDPAGATSGDGIRSILNDDDLYAASVYVNVADANSSYNEVVDQVIASRVLYKGTGSPVFYTTEQVITQFLLLRDTTGRRIYRTLDELAADLRVSAIVAVEVMEDYDNLLGIMVNLADYSLGADRGGELSFFDDFDIDYNQMKYLIETRVSGALTKIRSALVIRTVGGGAALVAPVSPTQDDEEVTVVTTTGVTHKVGSFTGAVTYNGSPVTADMTVTAAHPIVLPSGGRVTVYAVPASSSYYFANNVNDEWTFTYTA